MMTHIKVSTAAINLICTHIPSESDVLFFISFVLTRYKIVFHDFH